MNRKMQFHKGILISVVFLLLSACQEKAGNPGMNPTNTYFANSIYKQNIGNEEFRQNIRFTGVFTVEQVDNNGDGLFNQIVIIPQIQILNPGSYSVLGSLSGNGEVITRRASNDSTIPIAVEITEVQNGNITVEIRFSGEDIREEEYDGEFISELLIIRNGSGKVEDIRVFTLGYYRHSYFGE